MRTRSKLIAARVARGLKQSDLAKLAGVAQATISRVERGEVTPDAELAQTLIRELEVTLDDCVRVDERPVPHTASDFEATGTDGAR